MKKLAIIDWGIGGIGIYRLIKERLGGGGIVYFSDTGTTPYGKLSRRYLAARLDAVIDLLKQSGVSRIVIGCNAASTAIDDLADHGLSVDGVIKPAIAMAARLAPSKLAVIGGRRTVVSGVYRDGFAEVGIKVRQRIAQPLSAFIESGDTSSEELKAAAKPILAPIRGSSHILLACTHYPAIAQLIAEFVSPQTVLIDPAEEVVRSLRDINFSDGDCDTFFTTGDPQAMKRSAQNAFGVTIETVTKVSV